MKKIILFLIVTLLSSCTSDEEIIETVDNNRKLTLLKVDYENHVLLGGNQFEFENVPMSATIPLDETYIAPSDFGNYSLTYTPTNQVIFDRPIAWLGGNFEYVTTISPDQFVITPTAAEINFDEIQYFMPTQNILAEEGVTTFDFNAVWNAVKNLEITNQCVNSKGKIGFLLYTPGVGLFQPQNAIWVVILYQ